MMQKLRHIAMMFALILGAISMASTAQAAQKRHGDHGIPAPHAYVQSAQYYAQNQPQTKRSVSYAQAKSIARGHMPGSQVVDIRLNGATYRVRLQTRDGRVVDVYVDAATGRVR